MQDACGIVKWNEESRTMDERRITLVTLLLQATHQMIDDLTVRVAAAGYHDIADPTAAYSRTSIRRVRVSATSQVERR